MSLPLLIGSGGGAPPLTYVDDVFSAYTYTGTGSTQTITNGIDLAGKGGLIWSKGRSGATDHKLTDTARGVTNALISDTTAAQTTDATGITAVSTTGHTVGADSNYNTSGATYVAWTFRKAPKFFDIVTYTGNATNRTIVHSLGQEVGLIFIKRTDTVSDWQVYHRSIANTEYLVLNTTAAKTTGATCWNSTTSTTSVFSLGTDATVNASGGTYVAYLFAHDASADGMIQCGSFTSVGASRLDINLGFEPQFVMTKRSNSTSQWNMMDASRGFPAVNAEATNSPSANVIYANLTNAEGFFSAQLRSNGFSFPAGQFGGSGETYIYLAIRRPNKPPTLGTQVYNAIARTGTGAAATVTGVGFAPDLVWCKQRSGAAGHFNFDRLRGAAICLSSMNTNAEDTTSTDSLTSFTMDGFVEGANGAGLANINANGSTYQNWFFKRAPGVMDVVCYTGDGATNRQISHNLTAKPELLLYKCRGTASTNWMLQHSALVDPTDYLILNTTAGVGGGGLTSFANATSAYFLGTGGSSAYQANVTSQTYVAYLFATKAGISKVGSYTGNGSTQTINCGFAGGARFILIKRTDSAGDWYIWDVVRGLVAGNDPHLSLNTTAAEVTTDDSIDPDSSGFIVNQLSATNINVSSATYIFLAIA